MVNSSAAMSGSQQHKVIIGGKEFNISSGVLQTDSPNFFSAAFGGTFLESRTNTVIIDRDPDIFETFILPHLRGYDVLSLPKKALERLEETINNVFLDAQFYGLDNLRQKLEDKFFKKQPPRPYTDPFSDAEHIWKLRVHLADVDIDQLLIYEHDGKERLRYRYMDPKTRMEVDVEPYIYAENVEIDITLRPLAESARIELVFLENRDTIKMKMLKQRFGDSFEGSGRQSVLVDQTFLKINGINITLWELLKLKETLASYQPTDISKRRKRLLEIEDFIDNVSDFRKEDYISVHLWAQEVEFSIYPVVVRKAQCWTREKWEWEGVNLMEGVLE